MKNEHTENSQETIQQDKRIACWFGYAWIFLAAALALHVTDEATTDFLSVYNPIVRAIRERLPFLLIPTFTFGVWLTGLCIGIALLFFLLPLAFRGNRVLIWIAFPLSIYNVRQRPASYCQLILLWPTYARRLFITNPSVGLCMAFYQCTTDKKSKKDKTVTKQ